jgi:hypothetical protein
VVGLAVLVAIALAQKPLTGMPNEFAQQVISDLGMVVEECPDNPSAKNDRTICFYVNGNFADFRKEWDSWASIRMMRYDGKTLKAWTKGQGFYQTVYRFGPELLAVMFIPGGSNNLVVLLQNSSAQR